MNTYVLVKGKNVEAGWYELVAKKEEDTIERLASRFSKSMTTQFLNGRKGLDHEVMDNFLWRYIENVQQYLKEGKTLLINRVGGMMFMEEELTILKTTKDKYFPTTKEHVGLSGWLTPTGEFHKCEHGEHWQFAREELKKEKSNCKMSNTFQWEASDMMLTKHLICLFRIMDLPKNKKNGSKQTITI